MTKRIAQLIEEQEKLSKSSETRSLDIEAKSTQKDEIYTLEKEEVIHLNPR
jgi:hypothetical protein